MPQANLSKLEGDVLLRALQAWEKRCMEVAHQEHNHGHKDKSEAMVRESRMAAAIKAKIERGM